MASIEFDDGNPEITEDGQKDGFGVGTEPIPSHPLPFIHYNWVDVTEEFFKAVKGLELGELLHDELFGLFEAMSAIEMMDPKMDAGMLCNRGNKTALNFDQAVKGGVLKVQDLSIAEQIGIIDSTFACLVSWLEGHSLAQTVFTNLYLHKPHQIEDRPIKAFSICVFKIVDVIKDFVNRAQVFEEEDFQPMVYGYRLIPDVTEQRAVGMLKEVEEDIQRRIRGKVPDISSSSEHDDLVALMSRIKLTRLLYQALCTLGRRDQQLTSATLADCPRLLSSCLELLSTVHRTVGRGVQPEVESDHPTIMGFDPLVNQRLLPPTFPRYTKIKSRIEAFEYFEELLNRLKVVCKITNYTSFHSALDFFIDFSRHGPCILSRSILQLLYLPQCNKVFGSLNFVDVLRDAAKNFIFPPALMPRSTLLNNQQAKEFVESFLGHCVRPFGNLIQLCGHNRARQRDKLAHLLEDFAALQDEAERVDGYLHTLSLKSETPRPHLACFGTWILYHTLRIMIMYLLSGFELELYSTHEYHYIFWYMYEFLYSWLVSALNRAESFFAEQESVVEQHNRSRANKKNKAKKKKMRPYGREIMIYQALQNICGGLYKAMVGFRLDGKIRLPHPEFDNEQVRYEHRFAPFASLLTPPPMQYTEFREMTSLQRYEQPPTSTNLYLSGCQHFHKARTILEGITNQDQEVNDLLKVAKTNFVVLKLLAGGHKKDSTTPPEFDFSTHRHFPIIKLP
ncbi:N-alpha-acetyltransferase 35, NatC auxiliary subunit [Schistocerca piceifrons]|uniref:N-alpha-acetyltransferase 35, NatC auxiliary subunit n=1 Tax=Schistocerca piceifrons TaxID=274613 RepID=UPI001F5F5165|nr:N-alpha-acetyltransferase 35, NatC auxiliary subunit [Schistocerca piceifrons]XP_049788167.1 N-alpha-acetyltransferase 35, NatC auxiliary subunit [Schistocerca cancellata]